ncbi:MAG: serine O-acetyltransferase [Thermotogaceae bacterium]|nr:serine O-acetyltransferase [Thermotogaceae bacterium]MDN5337471.1 serine O-acetyltransferase [Thermotogaceae bacterium]
MLEHLKITKKVKNFFSRFFLHLSDPSYRFRFILNAIKEDLKIALEKDPAADSKWDIILFSTSFHGLVMYRIYNALWYTNHKFSAKILYYLSKILFHMDIHPAARIEPGVLIDHGFGVVIGSTATIGKGTVIYHGVTLGTRKIVKGKRHPDIGRNVLIGAGAKILGPIKIGDDAQVGANSVVLKNVESGSKVAGIPAREIKRIENSSDLDDKIKEKCAVS